MLRAYMDDSGTHAGSPYCLVGGYWGGTGQWSKFGREWDKILKAFNVPEFHAKQFWARDRNKDRVGPYKGWDDNRRESFLSQLLDVIGAHKIYPFAHGVSRRAWEQLSEVQQRAICGPSGKEYTAPNNPMFVAFRTCVIQKSRTLSRWCKNELHS